MARPLRLEFPGAFYHVTARGNAQQKIYLDEQDRALFLDLAGKEIEQQGWVCYAYCLMGNHYHLLIETPEPNLVRGMRRLNGVYTQSFNRRHGRVGHVFQGRYKAILVEKDAYLQELCRYVVLNPVRARAVKEAGRWPWSSYRAMVGAVRAPRWLAVDEVRRLFSSRDGYRRFVAQGMGRESPWVGLRGQIYLGGEAFLARMEQELPSRRPRGISRSHFEPSRPDASVIKSDVGKAYGIARARVLDRGNGAAFKTTVYLLRRVANLTLCEVASLAGVSPPRVSQIQAEIERGQPTGRLKALLTKYEVKA